MDGSSWRFSEPSTYANANLVPTARKPSPEGQLKICTDTPEVNRFREKWPVRTQNSPEFDSLRPKAVFFGKHPT